MHTTSLLQLVLGGLAASSAASAYQPAAGGAMRALSPYQIASILVLAAPAMAAPMVSSEIDSRSPHHAGKKTTGKGKGKGRGKGKHPRDAVSDLISSLVGGATGAAGAGGPNSTAAGAAGAAGSAASDALSAALPAIESLGSEALKAAVPLIESLAKTAISSAGAKRDVEVEAREPHHAGKKTKGHRTKGKHARDAITSTLTSPEGPANDAIVAALPSLESLGNAVVKAGLPAAGAAAAKRDVEVEAREPHHAGRKTKGHKGKGKGKHARGVEVESDF